MNVCRVFCCSIYELGGVRYDGWIKIWRTDSSWISVNIKIDDCSNTLLGKARNKPEDARERPEKIIADSNVDSCVLYMYPLDHLALPRQ